MKKRGFANRRQPSSGQGKKCAHASSSCWDVVVDSIEGTATTEEDATSLARNARQSASAGTHGSESGPRGEEDEPSWGR